MTKRERYERDYYKAIKNGKFEEAKKIMNKIVKMDVENAKKN